MWLGTVVVKGDDDSKYGMDILSMENGNLVFIEWLHYHSETRLL